MSFIRTDNLKHRYDVWRGDERSERTALDGVNLNVERGEFIAILGANGSGKSTLAKHLNVLLLPDEGTVLIDGKNTGDTGALREIRDKVGMVFQNPDNQIVGTSVEEDTAFGPENRNMESGLIQKTVASSLEAVGLLAKRKTSPFRLSGGEKQRVAVAGVLAAGPACIVLDEPTAMLDPASRRELMEIIHRLHEEGGTIILITHHTDETLGADRIILMESGRVLKEGTPAEIFADRELLERVRMDMPPVTELGYALKDRGIISRVPVLSEEALIDELGAKSKGAGSAALRREGGVKELPDTDPILSVRDVEYTYGKGTANETGVLHGVSFDVHRGECIGIAGTSGAGKTTLLKHLNGLLRADKGDVLFRGESIYRKRYKLSSLRRTVGLVFQNAESQLFCKTVIEDVKFGPRKMGMSEEEAQKAAEESLALVALDREYYEVSPQDLSGGQKRRAAIAGILAMRPEVLVLDEPAAGLDPGMKAEIFGIIDGIRRERGTAVIIVSHEMEDIARYADRVMILSEGRIELNAGPKEVFSQVDRVRSLGADVPGVTEIMYRLREKGLAFNELEVETEAAADAIASALAREVSC